MSGSCFRLDEIATLLEMAPDDPRRQHLDACPLCQSRLAAYRGFVAKPAPLPGSDPENARIELERFIGGLDKRAARGAAWSESWSQFRARLGPRRVFALGIASAAVALLMILHPFLGHDGSETPVLRGPAAPGASAIRLETQSIEDGDVVLRWNALAEADLYEVQVFDTRLDRVARFSAGPATTYRLQRQAIPAGDGPLFCRIAAFRGGDEVAASDVLVLDFR
jgi:hypothetical protein